MDGGRAKRAAEASASPPPFQFGDGTAPITKKPRKAYCYFERIHVLRRLLNGESRGCPTMRIGEAEHATASEHVQNFLETDGHMMCFLFIQDRRFPSIYQSICTVD